MQIAQIFDAFYLERQQRDRAERGAIHKFRMSDAGRCRLMRYWKLQGKPAAEVPIDALRNMQAGNVLHDFFGSVIADRAITQSGKPIVGVMLEGKVEDEHRIGHYDIWAQTLEGSFLIDLKTVKGKEASYLEKYGKKAKHQHVYQIVSYADLLVPRPDKLLVVYVERETLRVVLESTVDYALNIKDVEEDWRILIDAWNFGDVPEPNPDDTWECKFCGYRDVCPTARMS